MEEEIKTQKYELSFLLDKEDDVEIITKYLEDNQAEVDIKSELSYIDLSYPIEKHDKAHFGYVIFKMPTANAPKLTESLRMDANVLRTLLIASPSLKTNTDANKKVDKPKKPEAREVSNEALEEKLAALEG